jgi:hypothetical protein
MDYETRVRFTELLWERADRRKEKAAECPDDQRHRTAAEGITELGKWFTLLPDVDPLVEELTEALMGFCDDPDKVARIENIVSHFRFDQPGETFDHFLERLTADVKAAQDQNEGGTSLQQGETSEMDAHDEHYLEEQVLYVEPEPQVAILREIHIAPGCIDDDPCYTECWLEVGLRFEVVRSKWPSEWFYGTYGSKGVECVFGDRQDSGTQDSQTLRLPAKLPLGERFQVSVYQSGGIARILSRVSAATNADA